MENETAEKAVKNHFDSANKTKNLLPSPQKKYKKNCEIITEIFQKQKYVRWKWKMIKRIHERLLL